MTAGLVLVPASLPAFDGQEAANAGVDPDGREAGEDRLFPSDLLISVISGDRVWRMGMEAHDGRPSLGEFFQDDETHTAFGLWLEF